jgi:hypothetical protein
MCNANFMKASLQQSNYILANGIMPAGYPQENINCVSEDSLEYPVINRWGWDIGFYCHFQKCFSYIPPCVGGYAWVSTICLSSCLPMVGGFLRVLRFFHH